jgi:hypothetical protein
MVVTKAAVVVVAYAAANAFLYVWFIGLHGAPAPSFLRTFAVVAAIAVLSNIPISLNGLGLREQLHASLLLPLGVPREIAVAMSLLLYAHLLVASLLGFMFWLKAPPASGDIVQAS